MREDPLRRNFEAAARRRKKKNKPNRVLDIPARFRESLLKQMARAYEGKTHKGVPIENPFLHARWILDRAIRGLDAYGKPWKNCPNDDELDDMELLRRRLRVLRYDMDKGEVIGPRTRRDDGADPKEVQDVVRTLLPGANKENVSRRLSYGSDLNVLLTPEEQRNYKRFIRAVLREFPQLNTASDRAQVEMLALLKIRMDRTKAEIAVNPDRKVGKEAEEITRIYRETLESLGISGKQRKAAQETERQGTIAELAMRYERTMKEFPTLYQEWLVNELKLLLQAYDRGDIDEWVIRYWAGNIVEAGTGRIVPLDVPKIREILQQTGIVPAAPPVDETVEKLLARGDVNDEEAEAEAEAEEKEEA